MCELMGFLQTAMSGNISSLGPELSYSLFKTVLMLLKGRVTERVMERKSNSSIYWLTIQWMQGCSQEFYLGLHVQARGPSSAAFPHPISGSQVGRGATRKPTSSHGMPVSLNCCATTFPPTLNPCTCHFLEATPELHPLPPSLQSLWLHLWFLFLSGSFLL